MSNKIVAGLIAIGAMAGCKLPAHVAEGTSQVTPASYKGISDTTTVNVAYHTFFSDPLLVALIDTALRNNADIQMAAERIEMARANVRLHRGALLPKVDLDVSAGGRRYGKYTIEGAGNAAEPEIPQPFTPDYLAGLVSTWEVDLWGKLKNKKKAAQLKFLATAAGRELVASSLVSEVSYRYYTLVALDEEIGIIRKNVQLQEKALEIVKLQKEAGRATELAVKQFTAQLATTRAMEHRVLMSIGATENELNFLLGRFPARITRAATMTTEAVGMTGVGVPSTLLRRRPDIVQAELELRASEAEVKAARAEFLPSFNISAMAGFNAYNTSMLFNPGSIVYGLAGGLAGPVLNRSQVSAGYDLATAEHNATMIQYRKTVMNAIYEVCTSLESIEHLQAQYGLHEEAARALNDAISISNDIYLAGYANYLEVITAQKNALEAELEVVQIRKSILFGKVNLYRAIGGR